MVEKLIEYCVRNRFLVLLLVAFALVGAWFSIRNIPLDDPSEAIPAFLTMIGMPLFFSISDGLAIGLVSYALVKILAGKAGTVSPLIYILAVLFVLRYAFLA